MEDKSVLESEAKINVIISRIKKLMRHAESAKKLGSLEEAETFSAKVEELMIEYNIELSQIDLDKDTSYNEHEFDKWQYSEKINYKDNQAGQRWRLDLVAVLSKHNFCNYVFNSGTKTFKIYGQMENVDTVVWMYNFLSIGLYHLAVKLYNIPNFDLDYRKIYNNNRYFFLKDWLSGAVQGINNKLQKQKDDSIYSDKITGLVLYNNEALVRFLTSTNKNVKTVNLKAIQIIGPAYEDGIKAGENYNINSRLSTEQSPKKVLKTC
jgi:hypothetical protein